ncbi:hypothetical protein CEXT_799661 [Caerostris extrusa]|uniref:Uncharacterized protein n=1 Tax=Caerostris extrusa TaxID=172846 RepID=A0AAV4M3C1_CAEEX|nr:hypothetical protein CEXT_799661 [Caerostris extrusa]
MPVAAFTTGRHFSADTLHSVPSREEAFKAQAPYHSRRKFGPRERGSKEKLGKEQINEKRTASGMIGSEFRKAITRTENDVMIHCPKGTHPHAHRSNPLNLPLSSLSCPPVINGISLCGFGPPNGYGSRYGLESEERKDCESEKGLRGIKGKGAPHPLTPRVRGSLMELQ